MLAELTRRLKALHLYGMAAELTEMGAERARKPEAPEVWLQRLVDAESMERQARSMRYQLHVAKFPIHRDLDSFQWPESPLDEQQIRQLASGDFMETARNLILVGGTGTGKTHLATALGVAEIHAGKRVRFYNAVDLVNKLEKEKTQGRAGALARRLTQVDAVILDELGPVN
nr:ATP-binding protein [Pseudomonadota bacterium]